jgi:hypothetical protein
MFGSGQDPDSREECYGLSLTRETCMAAANSPDATATPSFRIPEIACAYISFAFTGVSARSKDARLPFPHMQFFT